MACEFFSESLFDSVIILLEWWKLLNFATFRAINIRRIESVNIYVTVNIGYMRLL